MSNQTQTFTPEQLEELIQFAKDCECLAESTIRIALHRIPETLMFLDMDQTEEAEAVAVATKHVSENMTELIAARRRLEKAKIHIWHRRWNIVPA